MKIVHINCKDTLGGASIACRRLTEAMIRGGQDASMYVVSKASGKNYVKNYYLGYKFFLPTLFRKCHDYIIKKLNTIGDFSIMSFGFSIYKDPNIYEADAIFIHWVNSNMLSINDIGHLLSLNKPVFWYMHDMFPITGGCHHALGCKGYKKDCRDCPHIKNKKLQFIASKQLRNKIKAWGKYGNLEFVTPSHWLANAAVESNIAVNHKVHVVPNVIDVNLYKPLDYCTKTIFGLDPLKKTILFGAAVIDNIYKGAIYIHDCLKLLDANKYEALIIGNLDDTFAKDIPMNIVRTGPLSDDISLVLAYNACDTLIISSVAENYPNMVLEAMACGKPCVGFNTGGIPEQIVHKETGLITRDKTAESLVEAIEELFTDESIYEKYSIAARNQIVHENSYENVFRIHTELKPFIK